MIYVYTYLTQCLTVHIDLFLQVLLLFDQIQNDRAIVGLWNNHFLKRSVFC